MTGKSVGIGLRLVAPEKAAEIAPVIVPAHHSPRDRMLLEAANLLSQPKARPTEQPPAVNLLGTIDPSQDEFVRKVMETFGATVVKVTAAPAVQTVTSSEPSEDES